MDFSTATILPGSKTHQLSTPMHTTRREFLREILYKNIAIIAIQHSKIYFFDTFGDFSYTVK